MFGHNAVTDGLRLIRFASFFQDNGRWRRRRLRQGQRYRRHPYHDYDLPHNTRSELAELLITLCHRNGRLPDLLTLCRSQRPRVTWPRVP